MLLSKRLQAVADMVTPGNRVTDVGCDHAYTSIYLAKNMISPHIIAMDINQGPINRAKDNIIRYGYEACIEVRKSNGLEKIEKGEADSIIIAGMGGELTVQILTQRPDVVNSVKELILQPQSEIYKVREKLTQYGFLIVNEDTLKEDGKYYFIMKAIPRDKIDNNEKYVLCQKEHYYYGRLLLEQRHPILAEYLTWDYQICEEILKSLPEGHKDASRKRRNEIIERMNLLQSAKNYYENKE